MLNVLHDLTLYQQVMAFTADQLHLLNMFHMQSSVCGTGYSVDKVINTYETPDSIQLRCTQ